MSVEKQIKPIGANKQINEVRPTVKLFDPWEQHFTFDRQSKIYPAVEYFKDLHANVN